MTGCWDAEMLEKVDVACGSIRTVCSWAKKYEETSHGLKLENPHGFPRDFPLNQSVECFFMFAPTTSSQKNIRKPMGF